MQSKHPNRYTTTIKKNGHQTFIILAAGYNKTRGEPIPKSLIPVTKNRLAIDEQIFEIQKTKRKNRSTEIIVVSGFEHKMMLSHIQENYPGLRIINNPNYKNTTSLESLRLAINCCLEGDLYVIHGDRRFKNVLLTTVDDAPTIVVNNVRDSPVSVGVAHQKGMMKNLSYGLPNEWGQIVSYPSSHFSFFRSYVNSSRSHINLFELINNTSKELDYKILQGKNIQASEIKKNENIGLQGY